MSELISGKEALIALANGEEVLGFDTRDSMQSLGWWDASSMQVDQILDNPRYKFKLKPRTITINDSDVPCCFSIGINRVKGKIEIDFKNTDDADVAYRVLKGAFGF